MEIKAMTPEDEARIETEMESDGRWLACAPDFPGVMAYGSRKEEAVERVRRLLAAEEGIVAIDRYIAMRDADLIELYQQRRGNGDGESAGGDAKASVADAVEDEGWEVVRDISERPDVTTLLARDGDALYIVSDIEGAWAIQLTYSDGEDRLNP